MKRTDDFLADLETQLGAAAAGALPRRRRSPARILRPLAVTAVTAAAVTAFVLAAATGDGTDPERAADPPPPAATSSGAFALPIAQRGECASDPGRAEVPDLSVLERPGGFARADARVQVIGMADVRSCVAVESPGPGACVVVDLGGRRTACWPVSEIEAGRAVAGLGEGFVIALVPDRVREVTFVIGDERDTYSVLDNVVVGNLENAEEGASIEVITGTDAPKGCADGVSEDGPLPEELLVALPVLREVEPAPTRPPDALADRLAKAGAERMWLGEARRHEGDGSSEAWLVPVADSRFAECGDSLIDAPRVFEGPGACLAILHQGEVRSVLCTDLDDLPGVTSAAVPGGRVAAAFLPHGTHTAEIEGTNLRDMEPPWGFVFGPVPDRDALSFNYIGDSGPVDFRDLKSRTVMVLAPTEPPAVDARERLTRAGVETVEMAAAPAPQQSRVMYAAGMARAAREAGELVGILDVRPLDVATEELADPQADVVVVVGEDVQP